MTDTVNVRPPLWFWLVSGLALLWNLLGVAAYVTEAYGLAQQSDLHRQLADARPAWATAAYAIAVFAGAAGALGLLLRRRWARALLLLSFAALIVQQVWTFAMSNALALLGQQALLFPLLVVLVSAALVWFAGLAIRRGWLR